MDPDEQNAGRPPVMPPELEEQVMEKIADGTLRYSLPGRRPPSPTDLFDAVPSLAEAIASVPARTAGFNRLTRYIEHQVANRAKIQRISAESIECSDQFESYTQDLAHWQTSHQTLKAAIEAAKLDIIRAQQKIEHNGDNAIEVKEDHESDPGVAVDAQDDNELAQDVTVEAQEDNESDPGVAIEAQDDNGDQGAVEALGFLESTGAVSLVDVTDGLSDLCRELSILTSKVTERDAKKSQKHPGDNSKDDDEQDFNAVVETSFGMEELEQKLNQINELVNRLQQLGEDLAQIADDNQMLALRIRDHVDKLKKLDIDSRGVVVALKVLDSVYATEPVPSNESEAENSSIGTNNEETPKNSIELQEWLLADLERIRVLSLFLARLETGVEKLTSKLPPHYQALSYEAVHGHSISDDSEEDTLISKSLQSRLRKKGQSDEDDGEFQLPNSFESDLEDDLASELQSGLGSEPESEPGGDPLDEFKNTNHNNLENDSENNNNLATPSPLTPSIEELEKVSIKSDTTESSEGYSSSPYESGDEKNTGTHTGMEYLSQMQPIEPGLGLDTHDNKNWRELYLKLYCNVKAEMIAVDDLPAPSKHTLTADEWKGWYTRLYCRVQMYAGLTIPYDLLDDMPIPWTDLPEIFHINMQEELERLGKQQQDDDESDGEAQIDPEFATEQAAFAIESSTVYQRYPAITESLKSFNLSLSPGTSKVRTAFEIARTSFNPNFYQTRSAYDFTPMTLPPNLPPVFRPNPQAPAFTPTGSCASVTNSPSPTSTSMVTRTNNLPAGTLPPSHQNTAQGTSSAHQSEVYQQSSANMSQVENTWYGTNDSQIDHPSASAEEGVPAYARDGHASRDDDVTSLLAFTCELRDQLHQLERNLTAAENREKRLEAKLATSSKTIDTLKDEIKKLRAEVASLKKKKSRRTTALPLGHSCADHVQTSTALRSASTQTPSLAPIRSNGTQTSSTAEQNATQALIEENNHLKAMLKEKEESASEAVNSGNEAKSKLENIRNAFQDMTVGYQEAIQEIQSEKRRLEESNRMILPALEMAQRSRDNLRDIVDAFGIMVRPAIDSATGEEFDILTITANGTGSVQRPARQDRSVSSLTAEWINQTRASSPSVAP